jgi:CheY-like chemotaxis protein
VYGIGAVARMLGTTPAVLRSWEDRYGVVIAARSAGGQRQYSRDQVEQLRHVRSLVESGLHAAEAHRLFALRMKDGTSLAPATTARTEPASILLAERDGHAGELIEDLLQTEGYEVTVVFDRADALSAYEEHKPDLVFVELVMSGESGLELCHTLRAAGARIVATSALELSAAAVEAGAEAFLAKPLEPLQVLSTVEGLLGRGRIPSASGSAVRT